MTQPTTCPRCAARPVRDDWHPHGALSRTDDLTEVCSDCGLDEAIMSWGGRLQPQTEWPINAYSLGEAR